MSSKLTEKIAGIARDIDLTSPRAVADIDKIIRDLQKLRDFAASLHSDTTGTTPNIIPDYEKTEAAPWRKPGRKIVIADGIAGGETVASLIERYKVDAKSPYQTLRYRTRMNYDSLMNRLVKQCGDLKLADLKHGQLKQLYERWKSGGHVTQAHSFMTMLRGLAHFGMNVLENKDCERLSLVLHGMNFTPPRKRTEVLTEEHAAQIIRAAHEMGLYSIALAQALQSDCKLKQRDVIGEWVPHAEQSEPTGVIDGDKKWIRGVRWSDIDIVNSVLRRGKLELLLSEVHTPRVMDELHRLGALPTSGPMIIREGTDLPWDDLRFRRAWRKVADAAGVPKHVTNRDSSGKLKNEAPTGKPAGASYEPSKGWA